MWVLHEEGNCGKRCESCCIAGLFGVKNVFMQISKAFLFVCPALLCVAPLTLNAADTPEQIKARQALEKLYGAPPPTAAPVAPAPAPELPKAVQPAPAPKPVTPAPAPAPAKAPAPVPVAAQPYPVLVMPTPVDEAAREKAREALRQKMNELNTGGQPAVAPVAPAPAPVQPVPPVVAAPAPASTVVQKPAGPELVLPPSADPAAIEKARAAVRQQMAQLSSGVVLTPTGPELVLPPSADPAAIEKAREIMRQQMVLVASEPPGPAPKATPKGMPVFEPLKGPPPTISAERQAELSALLQKYRADLITPDQYHAERARILAK